MIYDCGKVNLKSYKQEKKDKTSNSPSLVLLSHLQSTAYNHGLQESDEGQGIKEQRGFYN